MKKLTLCIREDIFPGSNYQVFFNKKIVPVKSLGNYKEYEKYIIGTEVVITIKLEDEWNSKEKLNQIFSWLISLDFQFGSVYDRLPIYANYSIPINLTTNNDEYRIRIRNSEILKVNFNSIETWRKALLLQRFLVLSIVLLMQLSVIYLILDIRTITSFIFIIISTFLLRKKLVTKEAQIIFKLHELTNAE